MQTVNIRCGRPPIARLLTPVFTIAALLFFTAPAAGKAPPPQTVRVGFFQNRPLVFENAYETPKGIYIDLLDEIGRLNNWRLEYHYDSWSSCLKKLKEREIDLMTSIAYLAERTDLWGRSTSTREVGPRPGRHHR